jgi:DNA-binding beta-propeller fold protein YncE
VKIQMPSVLTGAVSIGPDGHYAVLFTTVDSANEQRVSILDLSGQYPLRTINLHKIVDGVTFDPTGSKAYVLHVKSLGDPTQANLTQDQITARSYAYSIIDLASTASMLMLTASQPGPIAALPDGSALFVLFLSAPWQVQRVDLAAFAVGKINIASQPTGIGFVQKAQQVFVSQAQADGRMTFVDWTNLKIRSVAGYEINSSIWE